MFSNTNKLFSDNQIHSKSKSAPKTTRLLLAELIQSYLIYSSELTYFAINTFQTTSLKRVQTGTLTRFQGSCVPRVCAFYYSLDREYEEFVQRMRKLCQRTRTTFLDIRSARIHYPQSSMMNIPETARSLSIFQCNIERLRDLKQIHQDLGHDLLLPSDQLFLGLDLLVTNFQLLLCELDHQVRFRDVLILQTFVRDIFLQFRVVLTWIYPAVQKAAYRADDPSHEFTVNRCEDEKKPLPQLCRTQANMKERRRKIHRSVENSTSGGSQNNSSLMHEPIQSQQMEPSSVSSERLSGDSLIDSDQRKNHIDLPPMPYNFSSLPPHRSLTSDLAMCSSVSTSDNEFHQGHEMSDEEKTDNNAVS